jgi:hypothetical protein
MRTKEIIVGELKELETDGDLGRGSGFDEPCACVSGYWVPIRIERA